MSIPEIIGRVPVFNVATTLAGIGTQFSDDPYIRALGGGLALLGPGAVLRNEFLASKNGYKVLRQLGATRQQAAQAFSGIPTYAYHFAKPLTTGAVLVNTFQQDDPK